MTTYLFLAISYTLYVMQIMLFIRVILSWFQLSPNNVFVGLAHTLTEPFLAPIRKLIDASIFGDRNGGMMLDMSPLIAYIFLQTMQMYIERFIR